MQTLGDFADGLERETFVGREEELLWFTSWLDGETEDVAILTVVGHGGVGKTALLRRFVAAAKAAGRQVRFVDGHGVAPSTSGLAQALGAGSVEELVDAVAAENPLVVVDSLDAAPELVRPLFDEILPRLRMPVQAVVAARRPPLANAAGHPLLPLSHTLRLGPFTEDESRRYLHRRGIQDDSAVDEVLASASGSPLATSIAADVVTQQPGAMLRQAGDWQRTLRELTERLLRGLPPSQRRLLEAASVVRQFDSDLLAALTDAETVEKDFINLARLSMVRPAGRRLRLHDDVREIISSDLRSHRRGYLTELRDRALRYYRRSLNDSDPQQREWLVNERLYLWEHDFIRTSLFPTARAEDYTVESARPEHRDDIVDFWREHGHAGAGPQMGAPTDDVTVEEAKVLADHDSRHFTFAVDSRGARRAVGLDLRLAQDTLEVLPAVLRPLIEAEFPDQVGLPPEEDSSPYRYLGPIVARQSDEDAMARLARLAIGSWIHGGTILVASTMPGYAVLMETLGFSRVELNAEVRGLPIHGLKLVLEGGDVEGWIDRITAALPPPSGASADDGLRICVLGEFSVSRGGRDVTPSKVAAAAVKHTVTEGGVIHVEVLIDRLWPDADAATGKTRLRGLLRRLREVSGDVLVREGDLIRIAPSADVDALHFIQEVNEARRLAPTEPARAREILAVARGRYQGDLLPGDVYVDVFEVHRERLRRTLITAWDTEALAAAAVNDVEGAILAYDRAIELEPYDESRYVSAAGLLHHEGETGRGLRYLRRARAVSEALGVPLSRAFHDVERDLHA